MGFVSIKQAPNPSKFEKNEFTDTFTSSGTNFELSKADYRLDGKTAKQLVKNMKKNLLINSSLKSTEGTQSPQVKRPQRTKLFTRDELDVGAAIARGGFGVVHRVSSEKFDPSQRYVFKTVYPRRSPPDILRAIDQIHREELFLSSLRHRNIIRLEGCSRDGYYSIYHEKHIDAYFIILPYLSETMTQRIAKWKQQKQDALKEKKSPLRFSFRKKSDLEQNKELFSERLRVALDIASAIEYLHEKRIVFRDLKPDNLGFDEKGCLKLFDFGLAVQLPKDSDLDSISDQLVGRAGTTRYMASEVLSGQRYNVKADVFSFSLVLWQILALEKPFGTTPEGTVYGDRPKIPKEWPSDLKRIIERGWSSDLSERPHMKEMKLFLEDLHRRVSEC